MDQHLVNLLQDGFASQQSGDLAEAEKCYSDVLEIDSSNEFALNLMGVLCVRSSRAQEAVEFLSRALSVNALDPETHNNLGLAHKELKNFVEARDSFSMSLEISAAQAQTLNNLGNVLAAVDDHQGAIGHFEKALKIDPQYVECACNLAAALKEVGRVDCAMQIIRQALSAQADNSRANNIHGEILLQATQYEAAKAAFQNAIEIDASIVAKINLSTALKQLGKEGAAMNLLREVLRQEPENSEAHNHLGVLYEQTGDFDAAAVQFRLALEHNPNHASAYYQLAKLKGKSLTDVDISNIQSLIEDASTPGAFRSSLHFALASAAEKGHDYESSMGHFIDAQAIKAARDPYDPAAPVAFEKAVKQFFPMRSVSAPQDSGPQTVPIFVVGMPRSGTTLTEQILSSHSQISGAGELSYITDLTRQAALMTGKRYPKSIESLDDLRATELRKTYLTRLNDRVGKNDFIVDKAPLNFNHIGTIATLFPEARIIYCRREAMDNCVSIFRLPFDDNQGYSHDLAALGHYYRQHEKLMEYWLSCYPQQILTVQYEDTVDDLEKQARRMLEFVGVDFQEAVLSFYDNKRIVMTPSAGQVRRPIYSDSVAAWKRYAQHLDPLVESLGEIPHE